MENKPRVRLEMQREGFAASFLSVLFFALFVVVVTIFSVKVSGVHFGDLSEYVDEPLFWVIVLALFGTEIFIQAGTVIYQFISVRRFHRVYVFSAEAIEKTIANNPPEVISWARIGSYSMRPLKPFERLIYRLLHTPACVKVEFYRKQELGTMFSDVVLFVDLPVERQQEMQQFFASVGVAAK